MMPIKTNVQSVVFIPGLNLKFVDCVYVIEDNPYGTDPIKCLLTSTINAVSPQAWIFNQRLRLGFVYNDGIFSTGSRVIFNIGELHYSHRVTNVRIGAINTKMLMKLRAEDPIT